MNETGIRDQVSGIRREVARPSDPCSLIPDTSSSRYTGRWAHRTKLVFRVWPIFKKAHVALRTIAEVPITGLYVNEDGHMEAWHQIHGTKAYRFELQDDDVDVLTAIAVTDAKRHGPMIVRMPGTMDEHVKKECWLEVPITVYPSAPSRVGKSASEDHGIPEPKNLFAESPEEAVAASGINCSKIVLVESDAEVDDDLIVREVVEKDALIVLCGKEGKIGVSRRRTRELMERSKYWVVPGRKPEEDGGALRGYQFCDRIVRWVKRRSAGNRVDKSTHMEVMHAVMREKGRSNRRVYFVDETVNRFAARVGMSRQRVMARFLDDGLVDAMIRSADQVKTVEMRDAKTLLRARVSEAINTLEFYYRATEAMRARRSMGQMGQMGRVGRGTRDVNGGGR